MVLFNVPKRPGREQDKAIASKSKSKAKATTTVKGSGLLGQINQIKAMVETHLGKFRDDYVVITTEKQLHDYISRCIENGVISIDTETTGLDPILNDIVGLCLYTPNQKAAYVPIGHISYVTGVKVDNQLDKEIILYNLERCSKANIDSIMFNAKFDIRVLRNQIGWKDAYCTWDCYLASRLMNENEESKGLKALHKKYVLDGKEDEFKFDALFKGITADKIPINTFYLYAAHDAIITYELYKYQKQYLYYDKTVTPDARNGMNGVSWVFFNIEMPCVKVVCDMEDNGVKFDFEYQQKLSEKYNKLLEEKTHEFYKVCSVYDKEIEAYKKKNVNHKLDDPINIGSPTQIAILLYDIMQIEPPDPKSPRGTGEAILQKIDNPIAKAILDYREMSKLVSTYIDKLPNCVNPKDGRIHCNFNQYGADTGRFSSSDPNLQNIPSHNKDIRKMFVATNEEKLVSTDTQQFVVDRWCEVECADKWKYADKIIVGDELLLDDGVCLNVVGTTITQDSVIIEF
jgi:DNA polymerase I-like protein with 3'-5' exonuclease and polymerase domains